MSTATPPLAVLRRTSVPLWLAVLLMAAAFAGGIVVNGIERPVGQRVGTPQIVPAPPLTGLDTELPPGHPPIGSVDGS